MAFYHPTAGETPHRRAFVKLGRTPTAVGWACPGLICELRTGIKSWPNVLSGGPAREVGTS